MSRGGRVPTQGGLALTVAIVVVVAFLPIFLPAPLGLGPTPHPPSAPSPPRGSAGPVEIAPAFHPTPGVRDIGALPVSTPLRIAVGLAPSDPTGLLALEMLQYTPGTPQYRHFLNVTQLTDRFGPSSSDYSAAVSYFTRNGLSVQTSPDRLLLLVSGSSGKVASAFHTSFESYARSSGTFYSHPTPATLPGSVPWSGALGLGNFSSLRPMVRQVGGPHPLSPLASCAGAFGLVPCQVQTAYDENGLLASGDNGTGYTIGVVDTYDSAEPQATLASDFASFTSTYSLPTGNFHILYPVPTSRDLNSSPSSGWATEEGLDVEWARASAPGDVVDMALAPDASAGLYAAVDWLVAHEAVNVLSLSWGEPDVGVYNPKTMPCSSGCNATSDGSYTLLHPVLEAAAVEGISVFSASGDCGAAEGTLGVSTGYPASDPLVTGVGGTDLTINGTNDWSSEVGWSGNSTGNSSSGCVNQGGSGGGFSPFPRPWWQRAPGVPTLPDVRGAPDVSIIGGTGVSVVLGGSSTVVAGTSESTPIWAGIAAIADQAHGSSLGLLNPSLYAIARGSSNASAFHDILSGTNGYRAGKGWDPVTGIGSPIVGGLVPLLVAGGVTPGNLFVTVHASPRFGPIGLTTTFQAEATGGAGSYAFYDIDFGDGNASLTAGGTAQHTYPKPGVFTVRATVFDVAGNSSTAPPVAVVVGGGVALNVTLTPSTGTPPAGGAVTFTVGVLGGVSPFLYSYAFGDGTYENNVTLSSVRHVYPLSAGYCAAATVRDVLSPTDGGASNRVSIDVGGAPAPPCEKPAGLSVTLGSPILRADVPADFPFTHPTTGGVGPVATQLASDDPYVAACNCGIFRTAGNHPVTVYANDSLTGEAVAYLNVTTYPAIAATFSETATSGPAPLSETFTVSASGGRLLDPTKTFWSFGDGTTATGVSVGHIYATPGLFLAIGNLSDFGFGNASEAFLIDVLPASGGGLVLSANITPAVHTASGAPMSFHATSSGGTAPYRFRWDLGDGNSALGANVVQTYSPHGCLGNRTCPLVVGLAVSDSGGSSANATVTLAPFFAATWSALSLFPTLPSGGGMTPFPFVGAAATPGLSVYAPVNVSWNFGDGGLAWGATIRHTFLLPGNFTVNVSAQDRVGDLLTRSSVYQITGLPQTGPSVSGGPNVTSGVAPLTVGFSVAGVGGVSGNYSFHWSFGDGNAQSNGSGTSHTYNRTGHFLAKVWVTDAIGDTGVVSYPITTYNTTVVQVIAHPSFTGNGYLALGLRVIAACGPWSIANCSDALVQVHLTWSKPGASSFPGNPNAGIVTFGGSGYANISVGLPSEGGTYHLAVQVVGPAFSGGVTIVLGLEGSSTTLGGISIDGSLILAVGFVFALAAGGVVLAAGRGRSRVPPKSGGPAGPLTP